MPSHHAVLSPSSSARWINCPASVRLVEALPKSNESSVYAEEGTTAHEYAEIHTARKIGDLTTPEFKAKLKKWRAVRKVDKATEAEMKEHVEAYTELVLDHASQYPFSKVLLEQRVRPGIESCWGTSDAVIVSPDHVEIIDFKYGAGVAVSATENSQLMLYGVGALEMFGDVLGDTKTVTMTIHQPRLNSVSSWAIASVDLRAWRDAIIPIATEALSGTSTNFGPSLEACRWCPIAGSCMARVEKFAAEDFSAPAELMTPDDLADALELIPEIRQWCEAVLKEGLDQAYSKGTAIPRHKVVLSGGRRFYTDEAAVLKRLTAAGYKKDQLVNVKAKGLGDMEKLVGKKEFPEILGDLLQKSEGSPALVAETDRRRAITPETSAVEDFSKTD